MCDKTDKDCMYSVGLKVGGFTVDMSLPAEAIGQPEKSLARHLCRIGFEEPEIVDFIKDLRWRAYLRTISLEFGLRGRDIKNEKIVSQIRQFYDYRVPAIQAAQQMQEPYFESMGL